MEAHADRDHAQWSASATERNWNCPGALALTMDLPESTSEAADWGTVCHEMAERCLTKGVDASTFLGVEMKGKKFTFTVDDEMVETTQTYVDYVLAQADGGATMIIEQKFSLASIKPPFEAGGTADAVLYFPDRKALHVIDLKTGKGTAVDATENKQLRTYALGALLANPEYKVETITVTIVQTRMAHRAGRIRSETFDVIDLLEWTGDLLRAMEQSHMALEAKKADAPPASWAAAYLKPGPHCSKTYCKAQGFCPALKQTALDTAKVWFDDLDQPRISNSPDAMDPSEIARNLDMLDLIEGWCNAVRSYAHTQAESGVEIPGYQLVEKIGNRAWKVDEEQIVGALVLNGLTEDRIYTRKLVTPAQAEKALGAKKKAALDNLVERPVRGTNLVAVDKTTRPAVTPAAKQHFSVLD